MENRICVELIINYWIVNSLIIKKKLNLELIVTLLTLYLKKLIDFNYCYDKKKKLNAVVKKVFSFSLIHLFLLCSLSCDICILYILSQFSKNFSIVLFHYDGRTTEMG